MPHHAPAHLHQQADTGAVSRSEQPLSEGLLRRITDGALDRELNRILPTEPVQWLDERRFGALRIPSEHGGFGVSIHTLTTQIIQLAEADSNVAHLYRGHFGFVESLQFKPEHIRQKWYRRITEGTTVGNASAERSGNALGQFNTELKQNDDGVWVLNGKKAYSTGTRFADYTRASAALAGESRRAFALVDLTRQGVTVHDDWDGFGQRLTGTDSVEFSNVVIDDDDVLIRAKGSHEAVHQAAFYQLWLLAVQVGIAKAALRDATSAVRSRTRTFNTSASGLKFKDDPLIQQVIGQMSSKVFVAEAAVLEAARFHDDSLNAGFATGTNDPEFTGELPQAVYASEIAVERAQITVPDLVLAVTQELFQALGASATLRTKALDRHWRNAQTISTHNPVVFRAQAIGNYEVNGTLPEGMSASGEAPSK